MKYFPLLVLGLLLAGCGSDETTGTQAATAGAAPAATPNPDPRVATIRQQHEQLLGIQKEYLAQVTQLKGYEKLSPERIEKSKEDYTYFIGKSQANLTALSLLDGSKAQEPAQIALVGDIAAKQDHVLDMAKKKLASIHDEHYLPQ